MIRMLRFALIILIVSLITGFASANTYYISASGSDSNNGTSKTTPWLNAPGMAKCSASCASKTPVAGDQFIFRGGDTWHYGNTGATPYIGSWIWTWSGSSGSPIYIGVDQTWYTGGSWVRPIITGDNPYSNSLVAACAYNQSTSNAFWLDKVKYVNVDNFEWPGRCWSGTGANSAAIYNYQTCNVNISNNYFHGWTTVAGSADNQVGVSSNATGPCGFTTYNRYYGNVFDGSDSSRGAANSAACSQGFEPSMPCESGIGIYGEGYDIDSNVFRYMSNFAVVVNLHTYHDNLAEYLYTSFAPSSIAPHSNVINNDTNASGASLSFYNNIVRHTYVSETVYLSVGSGGSAYVFNNVFFDNLRYDASGDTAPSNCIAMQAAQSTGTTTLYFYNNTLDMDTDDPTGGGCMITFWNAGAPTYSWNGPAYFENDHLIGFSNLAALYIIKSGATVQIHDNGNEVIQSTPVARSQGYTQSNNDSPTLSSNSTVGAGNSLANLCSQFSSDSELCGGTSDGVEEQAGEGGEIATFPAVSMLGRTPSWDAGAHQFSTGAPVPPTNLQAVVH
jgi:hypothetical protein